MRGFRPDNLFSKRTTAQAATGSIGSGANGVVTATVDAAGAPGNLFTMRSVLGVGADVALSAAISTGAITVTLGTDSGSLADDTKNSASLVAAAVEALAGVSAAASGSGATPVPVTSAVTFSGGHDVLSVHDLARQTGLSEVRIQAMERGDNCEVREAQRLADALSVALSALGSGL